MHNITFPISSVAQTLAKTSPFNAETDFAGISIAVYVPFVLTAHPGVPANELRELAALLRNNMTLNYNYGSNGPGSAMHVLGESFKRAARVDMEHIAFKGAAPMKQELLAGRIQVGGDQLSSSLAEIKAGSLRVLATTGSKRISPRDVIDRLNREVVAAVQHPELVKCFADLGAESVGSSPVEQEATLRRQMDQFRPVIRDMKLE